MTISRSSNQLAIMILESRDEVIALRIACAAACTQPYVPTVPGNWMFEVGRKIQTILDTWEEPGLHHQDTDPLTIPTE